MNITFVIKDEYTYFASGSPLVTGAEVRLVNPNRGYSESRYTLNNTGMNFVLWSVSYFSRSRRGFDCMVVRCTCEISAYHH